MRYHGNHGYTGKDPSPGNCRVHRSIAPATQGMMEYCNVGQCSRRRSCTPGTGDSTVTVAGAFKMAVDVMVTLRVTLPLAVDVHAVDTRDVTAVTHVVLTAGAVTGECTVAMFMTLGDNY